MKLYGKPYTTILLVFSWLVPFLWYFPQSREFLWGVSWYAVFILMLIRPLSELLPSQRWIKKLLPYRKELGILSAMVVVTNAFYNYIPMGGSFFALYFSLDYWDISTAAAWGHIAELVGFILLITSNKYSIRTLKNWWKPIQRTSYIYYYGAAILLISYSKMDVLVTALLTAVIAYFASYMKKSRLQLQEA